MIVSHQHKFAFIHIPKCAGSFVRSKFLQFDDRSETPSGVHHHPTLGRLDFVHRPLFVLKEHFLEDFTAVEKYWSFTLIRNPFERFASSLSQRLKMYGERPLNILSVRDVKEEIEIAIRHLNSLPRYNHLLTPDYIHFQKQSDYILLDDRQVVQAVYSLDELSKLVADIRQHIGLSDDFLNVDSYSPVNRSIVLRSQVMQPMIEAARPALRFFSRVLSSVTKERLRTLLYVPRDDRFGQLFNTDHVHDFIRDYYREDVALWQTLQRHSSAA